MQAVGVDLSAETKHTWMATIEWTAGAARLVVDRLLRQGTRGRLRQVGRPMSWITTIIHETARKMLADSMIGSSSICQNCHGDVLTSGQTPRADRGGGVGVAPVAV
jgi:hypothetical protein